MEGTQESIGLNETQESIGLNQYLQFQKSQSQQNKGEQNIKICNHCFDRTKKLGKLFKFQVKKDQENEILLNINIAHRYIYELIEILFKNKNNIICCHRKSQSKFRNGLVLNFDCNQKYFMDQDNNLYKVYQCAKHIQGPEYICRVCKQLTQLRVRNCIKCQNPIIFYKSKHFLECSICDIKFCQYHNTYTSILPQNECGDDEFEDDEFEDEEFEDDKFEIKIYHVLASYMITLIISTNWTRINEQNFMPVIVMTIVSFVLSMVLSKTIVAMNFISTISVTFIKLPYLIIPEHRSQVILLIKIVIYILFLLFDLLFDMRILKFTKEKNMYINYFLKISASQIVNYILWGI